VFNSNTFVTLTAALLEVCALLNVILVTNVDICNNFKQYRATSCHIALYIRTQGSSKQLVALALLRLSIIAENMIYI